MQETMALAEAFYKVKIETAKQLSDEYKKNFVNDIIKELCRTDLFFLLTNVLSTKTLNDNPNITLKRDWIYDRCKEVSEAPDGHIDLWSR